MTRIGYIVGSLHSTSLNRRLATAFARLVPEGVEFVEIPIKDLPLYTPDYDKDYPQVGRDYKQALAEVDGVVIFSPEYSRSIPGALKNALDWAARPYGTGAFINKPVATAGAAGGGIGTAIAQQHLRAILVHMGAIVMGQPEAYIQVTPGLITDEGEITNEGTEAFLKSVADAFAAFVEKHKA